MPNQNSTAANDPRRLYSIVEAAKVLGVSRGTVFTLLDRGELGYLRIMRRRLVPADAIERFIAKRLIEKTPLTKTPRGRRVA